MENGTWHLAADVEAFNPERYDFVWNEDYSMFRAVPLLWWDDKSYIAYQSGTNED